MATNKKMSSGKAKKAPAKKATAAKPKVGKTAVNTVKGTQQNSLFG